MTDGPISQHRDDKQSSLSWSMPPFNNRENVNLLTYLLNKPPEPPTYTENSSYWQQLNLDKPYKFYFLKLKKIKINKKSASWIGFTD